MASNKLGTGFDATVESGTLKGGKQISQSILDIEPSKIAISNMPADNGVSTFFNQAAQTAGKVADRKLKDWQEATIKEAAKVGKQGVDAVEDDGTYYAEAFNKAFTERKTLDLDAEIRTKDIALKEQYRNDPVGYEKAKSALMTGMLEPLKMRSETKDIATTLNRAHAVDTATTKSAISETMFKEQAAEYGNKIQIEAEKLVTQPRKFNLFSNSTTERSAAVEEMNARKAKLMDLAISLNPATGRPYMQPWEIENVGRYYDTQIAMSDVTARMRDMSSEQLIQAADGNLMMPDGRSLGEILGVKGLRSVTASGRAEEDRRSKEAERLETRMIAQAARDEARMLREEAKAEKAQLDADRNVDKSYTMAAATGALTEDDIIKARAANRLTHEQAEDLKVRLYTEQPETSAPAVVNAFQSALVNDNDYAKAEQILLDNAWEFSKADQIANQQLLQRFKTQQIKPSTMKHTAIDIDKQLPGLEDKAGEIKAQYSKNIANGMDPTLAQEEALAEAGDIRADKLDQYERNFKADYAGTIIFDTTSPAFIDRTKTLANAQRTMNQEDLEVFTRKLDGLITGNPDLGGTRDITIDTNILNWRL